MNYTARDLEEESEMHKLGKVVAKEDGAVLVFTVIILVVLLGMAALAIDIGQMYIAKQRAQNVCDAAALAGGQLLTGKPDCVPGAEATAIEYKDANNAEVAPWQVEDFEADATITTVEYDDETTATCEEGEAIKVTGRVHVNFAFAGIFGMSEMYVPAEATALLSAVEYLKAPPLPLTVVEDDVALKEFGNEVQYGVVGSWQEGDIGSGNWMAVDFNQHGGGEVEFIDRLAGTADPIPLATGMSINTYTGNVTGTTHEGLIGKFTGNWGSVISMGRILMEQGTPYSASGAPPDNWYTTGYNPNAWETWQNSQDPTTGMYPYTNRIAILPVIENPFGENSGSSDQVTIVGFVAFFINRVYDGRTYLHDDPNQRLGELGEIEGFFIQAIIGGGALDDASWIFLPGGTVGGSSVSRVRLIS